MWYTIRDWFAGGQREKSESVYQNFESRAWWLYFSYASSVCLSAKVNAEQVADVPVSDFSSGDDEYLYKRFGRSQVHELKVARTAL